MFVIVMAWSNSLIQGSTTACSYPFVTLGDNCYYFSTATASWDDAYIECLQRGAYLANLETFDEYMLLRSRLASLRNGQNYAIGGRNINREVNDGDWRWVKNGSLTKMSYFAFGPRQPTGSKASPENCMWVYSEFKYEFIDTVCSNVARYICEK